jgi:2,4-dienoyl-CoA reductase-like NADH-dependent reductase (Old Yellow Enzyme family)/thioredoxin reductase
MVDDGRITDQLVAYHTARAAGGVGLIIVQVAGVHETARYTSHVLMAVDDTCIPGYTRLAEAVRPYGTRLFGQLFHPGREVMESQDGSLPVAVAPSAVPSERFHVMPRALRNEEISEIVDGYGAAANRLRQAGLDGVEIVASHGYLPSQFLNPELNLRNDAYGGSPANRLRFLTEVLEAVRGRTDSEMVVGLRISIDEQDPFGLDSTIAIEAVTTLATAGLVDYVSVTTGTSASLAGSDHIAPDMDHKNAYVAPLSRLVRDAIGIPVFVAGRINQPQEAERVLESGDADACIMTRALICDPTMPELAEAGRLDDIRACIGCNQACIGHFHAGYPISCIQHPETGREIRFGVRTMSSHGKKVMVVGGGPAGMKAAAVAAERGHSVTLYEATERVGGQVLLAERIPGREEFGGAATNLYRELTRAGACVILRSSVDFGLVEEESPDFVVVATGARPYRPAIEVMGAPVVMDAWQAIRGEPAPKGHVVVVDWRSDWVGIGAARVLAAQGCRVTLVVSTYAAGEALQQYVRDSQLKALRRDRIEVLPLLRIFGVDDNTVYLQHVLTGEPVMIEGTAGIVLACGHEPVSDLLTELQTKGYPAVGAGDCLAPRTVEEAVLEGLVVGSEIR